MTKFDYDFAVLGGGAAGLTAAAGCAKLGLKTLLVEREPALGGDCLHYGCVPSKTLLHTAKIRQAMKDAPRFGLPAVDPGPVDFAKVRERIQNVIKHIQHHDSVERFCSLGAKVEFGQARFVSEHELDVDGKRFSAAKILVATGSSAQIPKLPGLDQTPYLTNRELFSLDALPKSLVVLGAGPIAVEMAQAFARLGSSVTVIQRGEQILSKEDKDMADIVMNRLAREGVRFLLETGVNRVEKSPVGVRVDIRRKSGETGQVQAERLLVALGRSPNVEELDLKAAGVQSGERGIPVDPRRRTTIPHIFAAGDVVGEAPFTHGAGYEAGIVVANVAFKLPRKADHTHTPWCTYSEPELASVGLNESAAKSRNIDYTLHQEPFSANDRACAEAETEGKLKLLLDKQGKPLGAQILGPHAGELIAAIIPVAARKLSLAALAQTTLPYPTLAEISKRVAGNIVAAPLFSETAKRILKTVFGFKGRACGE